MPLHDWTDDRGWDGVHQYWITELAHWLRPRLPPHFRAYLGSVPALTIDFALGRPDVAVREWSSEAAAVAANGSEAVGEPDQQAVALFEIDPQLAVHVYRQGKLTAVIEIVSPRNKDRLSAREQYTNRYLGYLGQEIHLLLVDVLPRPQGFSFADAIATASQFTQPPLPAPCAISYRVGGPAATAGRFLDIWRRPLTVGASLPCLPLALTAELSLPIDLEQTYARAAAAAYLE
jgi:uncharacterized protein DUF4058